MGTTTWAPDATYLNPEDTVWYKSDSDSSATNTPKDGEYPTLKYGGTPDASSFSGTSGNTGGTGGSGTSSSEASTSNDASIEDAEKASDEAEQRVRDGIHSRADIVGKGLGSLKGRLSGQQVDQEDKYGDQKDYSYGQTASALGKTMGRFDGYGDDIVSGQKTTLRDLSADVRNAFQAGNIYLGAKGASNSSAAGMYSRGIQQAANRNRSDVMRQGEENLANLNIRRTEAVAAADDQYAAIDNWFNTAVSDLQTQFNERKFAIEDAMVQADANEQSALIALNSELMASAESLYNELVAQQDFYSKSVSDALGAARAADTGFAADMDKSSETGYEDPTLRSMSSDIRVGDGSFSNDVQNPTTKWREDDWYELNGNPGRIGSKRVPDDAILPPGGVTPGRF